MTTALAFTPDLVPVRSSRHANVVYRVDIANGRCQCPGFTAHKHCYHIQKAREQAGRCGQCSFCRRGDLKWGCPRMTSGALDFQPFEIDLPKAGTDFNPPGRVEAATAQEAWAGMRGTLAKAG